MKKFLSLIFLLALVSALILSFGACGGKRADKGLESPPPESPAPAQNDARTAPEVSPDKDMPSESPDTAEKGASKKARYRSISQYVESDEFQNMMQSIRSSAAGANLEVSANGDQLVYTYTYDENMQTDGLKDALFAMEGSMRAVFSPIFQSLHDAVDVENPSIVVKYFSHDGSEIYSQEFFEE